MGSNFIITSDHQLREVTTAVAQIEHALSSEQVLKAVVEGLPREVIEGVRRSLSTEKRELVETAEAYLRAKSGDFEALRRRAGSDPGALLIVARITKGWSQKDLARKLGQREQAIQRYEAERYRSISLAGFLRVARALGVRISVDSLTHPHDAWDSRCELSPSETQKVLKHARQYGWLESGNDSDDNAIAQLKRHVAEHVGEYGTPSLLRTGLNVSNHSEDWTLLSWKAQVTRRAKNVIQTEKLKYRPTDFRWLRDLVRLSRLEDGPIRARDMLKEHGIVLIAERHITGMKVDGAAFLVEEIPVIGLTLLRDSLDNFWFTLLHEIAHVTLHYRTGLASGFFDDMETGQVDEFEQEANLFASNLLIPEELWSRSPARIAKTVEPIERLARQLDIAPAIIFGRIRMERKNYALFSNRIGTGVVRKQFFTDREERSYETA